ncbi:hypothetical protein [Claveliimonas bilis]|nr:hypothetical protein [Claveliimonas bilis]BDZ79953.1 hypothetical protein Lac3_11620 [Claveliimonas bilis]
MSKMFSESKRKQNFIKNILTGKRKSGKTRMERKSKTDEMRQKREMWL